MGRIPSSSNAPWGKCQDGKLTVDFFLLPDAAENVVIQSNGKIVLGGVVTDGIDGYGVARVLP